ncbi:hypothetical protein LTR59_011259 [Friedmanniomyces endolithicus]|nr:hypothetical protein LTR38_015405 [Friedmanniomyces endolithicus]KAK0779117.1 hypothetical protein LTR75_015456 [Friedmanniomyces endolithicus]KAK0784848.1 hypothetical protein LTR59_011259 [Friedmanniomyces endolithicus]
MLERAVCRLQADRSDSLTRLGTLLPFLYCTATIQRRTYTRVRLTHKQSTPEPHAQLRGYATRWNPHGGSVQRPARQPLPSRNGRETGQRRGDALSPTSRLAPAAPGTPSFSEGVPFEDGAQELIAGRDPDSDSTITPREKKVFEKLLSLSRADAAITASEHGKTRPAKSVRNLGLDAVLDPVRGNAKARERPPPQFPAALRPLAEEARDRQRASRLARATESDSVKDKAILTDLDRANALLDDASTDLDLWKTLQIHLLARVAVLELDGPPKNPRLQAAVHTYRNLPAQTRAKRSPTKTLSDLDLLTANLPQSLLHYLSLNTTHFSTSLLPLNLLPALHSLGPTAFALGATTQLYNAHLALLHRHYPANIAAMNNVLAEMDRQVYAFDEETLGIVDGVLRMAARFKYGHSGPGPRTLVGMEGFERDVVALGRWAKVMRGRREEAAVRKVREEEAERERVARESERERDDSVEHGEEEADVGVGVIGG